MKGVLSFAVATLGCKVNQYETGIITKELLSAGMNEVDFKEFADLYIINTCKVTADTEAKSRKFIRRASKQNPASLIVITGCYDPDLESDLKQKLGADIFIENLKKDRLVEIVLTHPKIPSLSGLKPGTRQTKPKARALLKIQDGCGALCSYCVIPQVRGTPRSRAENEILSEAKKMEAVGVKEIVLTGINLGAYGEGGRAGGLERVIKSILSLDGIGRLRLSSIEVNYVTDSLISLIATEPKMAKHLHIPLQSGSDTILKAMNRNYSARDFLAKVTTARKMVPEIAITTDIMVGFPGEKDDDFQKTLDFAKEAAFAKIHVFKFSQRDGTKAAQMSGKIESKLKNERSKTLIDLAGRLRITFLSRFIGKRIEVMIESYSHIDGNIKGMTDNYIKITGLGSVDMVGEIVPMRMISLHGHGLYAEII